MKIRRDDPDSATAVCQDSAPSRTAMIVVDDRLVSETVALQLANAGWTTVTAASVTEAQAVLLSDPSITVAVFPCHLTDENGFDPSRALAESRPERRAIECVYLMDAPNGASMMDGPDHLVCNPIEPRLRADLVKLVAAADQAAGRRRQHQSMLDELEQRVAVGEAMRLRLAAALRDAEDMNRALAESAGAARRDLLAVISHELKTPLFPIVGLADILLTSTDLRPEDVRESAGLIRDGAERLCAIIDRILTYVDADRRQAQAKSCRLALVDLIAAALQKLPKDTVNEGAAFAIDCPDDLFAIGAPDLLAEALSELVDNAIKAGPAGAKVRITAHRADDGHVMVDVSDTGPGLPDIVRRNLGTPFLPGDASFARRWSGVGLGLARARKIAQLHGGELEVAVPQPQTGTKIRLVLGNSPP
ncbi:ATP-binding protein [Pararhodobacter aggregans]|uniref:histidine kinase n=1 Tax=Pararhodobacter aggregans TaxID=404875 RepID=A0A2T7ULR2_9RHOB|nr:ATP-binding protein [Pararhodobacter aggregans]PTW99065.1 signal transduction histidine kinase [Pararhodobacter aggregans]PVE45625.1 hypothetical protein DDE23_20390 [Pararhodobacter aggregans]